VPGGPVDHNTAAVTTAQGFRQSEGDDRALRIMAFESMFRKGSVTLVAGGWTHSMTWRLTLWEWR
jgi:hypothetical protein